VTFLAYFTGGVRAWDIREPQAPVEVASMFRKATPTPRSRTAT